MSAVTVMNKLYPYILRKASTAGLASAKSKKKQRVSLESVESTPTGSETMPSLIAMPDVEETSATDEPSVAGPITGVEGVSVACPGSGDEGESFAGTASTGIIWASVAGPGSCVTEGTDNVPVTETSVLSFPLRHP